MRPKTILVVANQTLGGAKLLEEVKREADENTRLILCVPRTRPKHGNVIYDETVIDAAKVRIDLARRFMRAQGMGVIGEIGDEDPFHATMDAIAEHRPDALIISTLPSTSSGWMRRDLIERIQDATNIPVTHVEQDIDAEGLPFHVTLVLAAKTAVADELLEHLRTKAAQGERQHMFIIVVPQESAAGGAAAQARARMAQLVDRCVATGLLAAGMTGDPDPYMATMNALQLFRVDDIVISTLPATRSGWLRADLIERVRKASNKPVEHIEAHEPAGAAA